MLQDYFGQSPRGLPGLAFQMQRERLERIDAVDFTLAHDDGCGLADLDQADVVLAGASRVAKSVTCFYLAYEGICAANVPLIPGLDPPPELLALDPAKSSPDDERQPLAESAPGADQDAGDGSFDTYGNLHEIETELRDLERIMARHGWRRIDVSYMSVEEVAKEVISLIPT